MKTIVVRVSIPEAEQRELKSLAALRGTSQQQVLLDLVRRELNAAKEAAAKK
jgi:hypothetical protein